MKYFKQKISAISGLVLFGYELSAQTVTWAPNTAVPMSSTSMAIMAALFLMIGSWVLSKTQKQTQQFFIMALLVSGIYNVTADAIAAAPVLIEKTSSKTLHLSDGYNTVTNNYGADVTIIKIDPETCTIVQYRIDILACTEGTVLKDSESCSIFVSCNNNT